MTESAVCPDCNGTGEITDPANDLHWSNTGDAEGEDWCPTCTDAGEPREGEPGIGLRRDDHGGESTDYAHSFLSVRRCSETRSNLFGRNECGEFFIHQAAEFDLLILKSEIESMIRMCGGDPGGERDGN